LRIFRIERKEIVTLPQVGTFSPSEGYACRETDAEIVCWRPPEFVRRRLLQAIDESGEGFFVNPDLQYVSGNWPSELSPLEESAFILRQEPKTLRVRFLTLTRIGEVKRSLKASEVDLGQYVGKP